MINQDEKLNAFINSVMDEANKKKNDIENQMEQIKMETLEQKEIEFLNNAYMCIQREKSKVKKEGTDIISKVIIENKRKLFDKREELVSQITDDVQKKVDAFLKTDEYKVFLFSLIEKSLNLAGAGTRCIFIDENDARFLSDIKDKFCNDEISVDISKIKITGGCVVSNLDTNIIANDSIEERILEAKNRFVMESGLRIE